MGGLFDEVVKLGFLLTALAFALWVGGASVAAWVAWEKGREPVIRFVLAFFLTPLLALIALGAVPARHLARDRALRPVPRAERTRFGEPTAVSAPRPNHARPDDEQWRVAMSGASRESW